VMKLTQVPTLRLEVRDGGEDMTRESSALWVSVVLRQLGGGACGAPKLLCEDTPLERRSFGRPMADRSH
jgi:hypothetical protein